MCLSEKPKVGSVPASFGFFSSFLYPMHLGKVTLNQSKNFQIHKQ